MLGGFAAVPHLVLVIWVILGKICWVVHHSLCTFLNVCHILMCCLLSGKKNMIIVSPSVLWGRWIFAGYLLTDTQSPILQGRAAEVPYRKRKSSRCKDYAFYLLSVRYLLWMFSNNGPTFVLIFILLTLPDSLEAARAERRSHNSFRNAF